MKEVFNLWEGSFENNVTIEKYTPHIKSTDAAVVIFPGGGYGKLADHEGDGYANLLNTFGYTAFVVYYRVSPNRFPLPLLDARRAMRFVRHNAEKFGVNKDKILAMGSSAGGHLTALLSTYLDKIDGEGADEIDSQCFVPNGQILCYPVISCDENVSHSGSYKNLLGDRYEERESFSPDLLVCESTPKAFIWHTSNDSDVNVINSYLYATALRRNKIPHELHVYPEGYHGLGVAPGKQNISTWIELLRTWLNLNF